jgi:hypothetical protein
VGGEVLEKTSHLVSKKEKSHLSITFLYFVIIEEHSLVLNKTLE